MPEMQEHFPAKAREGRYAGPRSAPGTRGHFPRPCGSEMQEHFPAKAREGR